MERLIIDAVVEMFRNQIFCLAASKRSYLHGVIDAYLTLPDCDLQLVKWALDQIEEDELNKSKIARL